MKQKILAALGLIAVGVVGRLLPHLPNATPVTAIARVAAAQLGKKWAIVITLITLVVSDSIIGWYDWRLMLSVYASFAVIAYASWVVYIMQKAWASALFTAMAPLFFFFTTNTAVWALSAWYPKTIAGLLFCYAAGLPFLGAMIVGDGAYMLLVMIVRYAPQLVQKMKIDLKALRSFSSSAFRRC